MPGFAEALGTEQAGQAFAEYAATFSKYVPEYLREALGGDLEGFEFQAGIPRLADKSVAAAIVGFTAEMPVANAVICFVFGESASRVSTESKLRSLLSRKQRAQSELNRTALNISGRLLRDIYGEEAAPIAMQFYKNMQQHL